MPGYAPPSKDPPSIDNAAVSDAQLDHLERVYVEVKRLLQEKTEEMISLGLTDEEIEHELLQGRVVLPTGEEVGLVTVYETLSQIFETS